jgi:hypothetical protein
MHQDAVAMGDAGSAQPGGGGADAGGDLGPGPDGVAADQPGAVGEAAGGGEQQMRQVAGGDQRRSPPT